MKGFSPSTGIVAPRARLPDRRWGFQAQSFMRPHMVHKKRSSTQLDLWADDENEHVWQKRFYDYVWSERKRVEKLRYMHRNSVKRGLVATTEQWAWSSFRAHA